MIVIPAYDRPEMVWHCLDALACTEEAWTLPIQVWIDGRGDAPVQAFDSVVGRHALGGKVDVRVTAGHSYPGNSYTVLMALKHFYACEGGSHVYLVEDDVLVSPEFFRWHAQVRTEQPSLAAVMGVPDPGHGAYASLGVCLPYRAIALALPHIRHAYFSDVRGYCLRTFPPSRFDCEQDGLWARVLAGQTVAWASPAVVSHVGWYGYHRRTTARPTGTVRERYEAVAALLADGAALAAVAGGRDDVILATTRNRGTYTLSVVPGAAR